MIEPVGENRAHAVRAWLDSGGRHAALWIIQSRFGHVGQIQCEREISNFPWFSDLKIPRGHSATGKGNCQVEGFACFPVAGKEQGALLEMDLWQHVFPVECGSESGAHP